MENNDQFICSGPEELQPIAARLLAAFPGRRIFALYGEMGAGKTTFVKALCQILQVSDRVSSPTFAMVNVYKATDHRVVNHFDCYRMKSIEEAFDIGYEDYFYGGDYCFIEWPGIIEPLLPPNAVKVNIEIDKTSGLRTFRF